MDERHLVEELIRAKNAGVIWVRCLLEIFVIGRLENELPVGGACADKIA